MVTFTQGGVLRLSPRRSALGWIVGAPAGRVIGVPLVTAATSTGKFATGENLFDFQFEVDTLNLFSGKLPEIRSGGDRSWGQGEMESRVFCRYPLAALLYALAAGCSRPLAESEVAPPKNVTPQKVEKIHGTWVGADEQGAAIEMTFAPPDSIHLRVGDDSGAGRYTVDWSKSPALLDIDWGQRGKVSTLVEVSDETLRMENNTPGKPRPPAFSDRVTLFSRRK